MSQYTVLITSAVYSNYGIYNPQERILQTLATAKSAREKIPNATLILVDNSKVDVQNDTSAEFEELLDTVDYYIDNSDDTDIKYFHENISNYDIGKNSMEVLGLFKTLAYIANDQEMLDKVTASDRIFKLSGRYIINDKFDITKFDNAETKDKYVFKTRMPSWIQQDQTGVDHLLQTRLWSFTPSLFKDTVQLFDTIIKNMFETYNKNQYIDVEHSMAKFIPKDKLVEVDVVGLSGNIAPNGVPIDD